MRITYIAAGAGGMYCGACARDLALVRALVARGHDVQVVPVYTPLRGDGGAAVASARIFFGGINVYLRQASDFFQRMPRPLARLLDHPALLNAVSRFAISTDPAALGEMTVSVLAGREGKHALATEQLLDFLADAPPEIVVITNSLLSGLAPGLKARLGVPVLCMLQGEETFLNAMGEPHRTQAWELIRANAASIDRFIATYDAYGRATADLLDLSPERIFTIPPGVDTPVQTLGPRPRLPFIIGYLSVITPGKGLDLLVDAMQRLLAEGRDVRLKIAGKPLNPGYWREVRQAIHAAGLANRVDVLGEVDADGKRAFFRQVSAVALPTRQSEARGMVALEALSAGVPVVLPQTGIFPEMLELTGGGLLVPPDDAVALAAALARLQDDPDDADRLGCQGAEGVARHFAAARIAEQVQDAFTALLTPVVEELPIVSDEDDDDAVAIEE